MTSDTVLWIYSVLLVSGGLIGYVKAKSKVSLVTACVAAAILVLSALPAVFQPTFRSALADVVMAILLVVFAVRLAKGRKFIPAGLLLALTVAALALRHLRW